MKNSSRFRRVALAAGFVRDGYAGGMFDGLDREAEEVVAALIPAATNIIALVAALQGKSVSAADLQTIQNAGTQAGADLQLIQSLITAYQTADATAKPGILNQIQTAIGAVQANLQGLLPALHIQDAATQTKIAAVIGIVLSEVQSLAAIVPIGEFNASSADEGQGGRWWRRRQPPLTANEFVKSYNATLTAKTGNAALDRATAGLKIHLHGKLARWARWGCWSRVRFRYNGRHSRRRKTRDMGHPRLEIRLSTSSYSGSQDMSQHRGFVQFARM